MTEENRPNPNALLKAIQQESSSKKGRLKIFLGMAAGVGKTYAMLQSAQTILHQGVNVRVGIVNTHGRAEVAALLEGLTIIPSKKFKYKESFLEELDIDAILQLKPPLVLIDELAHTNAPGSRHSKRWQDIEEIVENGIDVFTTLNVQHIESLRDIIENIAAVKISETVPDSIIESAASIELVDLSPEGLLQRLKEGKVYLDDKLGFGAQNFFQENRLTALREIVLRYAAEKVDHDLHGMISTLERKWKPREKLLVAINPNLNSQKLIRTTRRLAAHLDAPWVALHVNTGTILSESDNNNLAKNLSLARDLGAEVITTDNPSIADGIQRISHQKGVTQIIIGRQPARSFFNIFQGFSLFHQLSRDCGDIDIHVMGEEPTKAKLRMKFATFPTKFDLYPYFITFLFVCLLTGINWLLLPYIGYKVVGVIFLMGILFLSLFFKKGPIFFASILYGLIWGFLFIPPSFGSSIASNEDAAVLVLYFLTAIATGILVDRERENKKMLEKREESAQTLYDIVRKIASSSMDNSFKSVKVRLSKLFEGSFEIIIKKIDDGLPLEKPISLLTNDKEINAAIWVFENGKEAGWSTDTLSMSQNLYLPLKGFHENVGVLVYYPKNKKPLSPEEKNFLYTVCQQLANYIERTFNEERVAQNEQVKQIEKMRTSLLNRISIVFQQPLVISQNALKSLKSHQTERNPQDLSKQIVKIENSLEQLIEILGNISAMAQLSEGLVPLNKRPHKMQDLAYECCESLKKITEDHTIKIKVQDNLPPISFDFDLIEMLVLNLITNAIYYSPLKSTIEIEVKDSHNFVALSVADEGKGIPENQLEAIFEKFYRLPDSTARGIGLGLSLAKAIASIHQGYLTAENRPDKGAVFSLFLPK